MNFEEFADIQASGRFRILEGMMEGKWFAWTIGGVKLHAASLYPAGDCSIIGVDVPDEIFAGGYHDDNLDRLGPASYFDEASGLGLIVPIWEWDEDDA